MERSYRGTPGGGPDGGEPVEPVADPGGIRRRLIADGIGIALSAGAFGVVYGLGARQAGLSIVEGLSMSVVVFAGASQFAAVGLLAQGVPWLGIVLLTALLNARHMLYAASLAPWFTDSSRRERMVSAHLLTDETYALALPAFRALRRHDRPTYFLAAAFTFVPWVSATVLGMVGGEFLPKPASLGLDIVFPAAMAGLAVALVVDRRAFAAAVAGATIGVVVALVSNPSVGILAGGLLGPGIALLVRESRAEIEAAETSSAGAEGLP